jgi:hypothetical protein
MIAKIRQPVESPERSSSSLVDVVCMHATWLPIQLWYRLPQRPHSFSHQTIEILDHALLSGLP